MKPLTPFAIGKLKKERPITMLTCYDAMTATRLEKCGVDILLVGDSCANVFLGESTTRNINIDQLAYHVKAVRTGAPQTHILADLDYSSCQTASQALQSAQKLIQAGANSVKMEGFHKEIIDTLIENEIPVCGHVGLLPQTAERFRVFGKNETESESIQKEARQLEESGVFLLVVESVPAELGTLLAKQLTVPVIGIGAGNKTDGQVLVINDLLGMTPKTAKFVRKYANMGEIIEDAVNHFIQDVKERKFPSEEESYR